jgi:hypothetical protein
MQKNTSTSLMIWLGILPICALFLLSFPPIPGIKKAAQKFAELLGSLLKKFDPVWLGFARKPAFSPAELHHGHAASSHGLIGFLFRYIGNQSFRGQDHGSNAGRILQGGAGHFSRINDS